MPPLVRKYNLGAVDSRDRDSLLPGEMQVATGVYYKPGDPHRAHKIDGRSTFGDTSTAKKVGGLELLQFDSGGTDQLVALSNSVLYSATPGATGTFSTLFTPTTSPTSMDSAHADNRHYVALGTENVVLKSGATTRGMGMQPPAQTFESVTEQTGGTVYAPDADSGGGTWVDADLARDSDNETYCYKIATSSSSNHKWSWASQAGAANRQLLVLWNLSEFGSIPGSNTGKTAGPASFGQSGNAPALGANVTITFEISEDSGTTYTAFETLTTDLVQNTTVTQTAVASGTNLSTLLFRATMIRNSGTFNATLRLHEITVQEGGDAGTNFNATSILYAFSEFDQVDGIESVPSTPDKVSFTAKNGVSLQLPAAAQNSNSTHWKIYKTPDNGTITQLGVLGKIPIAETVFFDNFVETKDKQLTSLVQMIHVTSTSPAEGILSFFRDFPPPNLRRIEYFEGSLVGLSDVDKRSMHYSVAGFPDSWPQINVIGAFPLKEHDELVDIVSIGQSLIIGANDAMIRMDELPRSVGGAFIASAAEKIQGAPGVVGQYAMTAVSYRGITNCAWISPENGVLVTDGDKWDTITDDVDWTQFDGFDKSNWVLKWIRGLRALILCYSSASGGSNDEYMILHLDKDHMKANGQAKITWPHYGKISTITAGQVSNTYRIYEGHYTDGKVYQNLDSSTGADSSLALDGSATTSRLLIKGSRNYEEPNAYQIVDGNLHHTDFGTGQTCTVAIEVGRDQSDASETVTKTVTLNSHKGTRFHVGRSGEWAEETITHDGTGRGAIKGVTLRANEMGHEGAFEVVN